MTIVLIVYDNNSFISHFPLNIGYIASILRNEGHEVIIYDQAIGHYSEEHLTSYLEQIKPNLVGIGSVAGYYPYKKLLKISEAINNTKNRKNFLYVMGGHMVSADPIYFTNKMGVDAIIVGEGEEAIKEVCSKKQRGIYKSPQIQDLDNLPFPAYDLFDMNVYRLRRMPNSINTDFVMSMITGRGCTWNCTFCWRMMEGMRLRSVDNIIKEIKFLNSNYGVNYIDFEDDLTMVSKDRMMELSETILSNGLEIKWYCEGRLNYVDEEVLTIMKRAGCVFINYGIESVDNKILSIMKKGLTEDIIIRGVELTKKVGINQGLNIIWGFPYDYHATLQKSVDFLIKYEECLQIRTIRPVTCYPNSPLYYEAIKLGLLKDIEDFYTKHINSDLLTVNFTDYKDVEVYKMLYQTNRALLCNYYTKQVNEGVKTLKKLYEEKNAEFRGFRNT